MSDMQLVIEQLSSGAAFFRDLEPESQIDFLTKVKLEYDSNPEIPLSGEATQALILSTLGLLRAGVRHTTPTHLDREDLYTYEDAMHDTVATMGSGWLTFVDPNISFGTYFRQRALAVARTKLQREGQNGLRYPSNLNVGKIVRNVYDILEEKKLKLPDSETFRDAVANSGSSNTVIGRNPLEIGRAVFFFRTIDTLPSDKPSDDQEWEKRLEVESDVDDDEWLPVADSTDEQESRRIEDLIDEMSDNSEAKNLVSQLPWDVLTDREKAIIYFRFGFNGGTPHNIRKTGEKFRLHHTRIRQILDEVISALLDPSDRREQALERTRFPLLVEQYADLVNVPVTEIPRMLEVNPSLFKAWINGSRNTGVSFRNAYCSLITRIKEFEKVS